MNWGKVKEKLGQVAPPLGRAFGGLPGEVVGGLVAQALGTQATPATVLEALERDPEAALKLRELEAQMQVAFLGDVQDARRAHRDHWMPWALTLCVMVMWAGWRLLLMAFDVPEANLRLFEGTTQTLDYLLIAAASYWIGSSRGSADKQSMIERKL